MERVVVLGNQASKQLATDLAEGGRTHVDGYRRVPFGKPFILRVLNPGEHGVFAASISRA